MSSFSLHCKGYRRVFAPYESKELKSSVLYEVAFRPSNAAATGFADMVMEWHAAHIKPNGEKMATEGIVGLEFRSFYPIITFVLSPHTLSGGIRRGPLTREEPLIPGYLFILFDVNVSGWKKINGLPGIIKLLPIHLETPTPINGSLVEDWIECYRVKGRLTFEEAMEAATRYIPGDIVNIVDGPFVGQSGSFLCRYYTGGALLCALQTMAGKAKVPAQCVEPASRSRQIAPVNAARQLRSTHSPT